MRYHVVLSRFIDLDSMTEEAGRGLRPRHAMKQLADRLNATVHSPAEQVAGVSDKVLSKLVGSPQLWAFARNLADRMSANDVLYCPDEAIGLPLAALCGRKRDRPKVAVMIHNVDRPRTRLAMRASAAFRSADLFMSVSQRQVDFLRGRVGIEERRAVFVNDQTDLNFFKPGPPSGGRRRPILVSAGLERRDYSVLAAAVADLDVDVRITGFSADAPPGRSSFPDVWPANFSRRRYEWPELAQLYRDADAVVVTLVPNIYAAGITTMVEGMATGRPVIVTRTEGLDGYLDDTDALTIVSPGNVAELRDAILALLNSKDRAAAIGRRAAEIAAVRYGSEIHVETIARMLERLPRR